MLTRYRTVVVGADGFAPAGPTVARAAELARRERADLVVVCAFADAPRRGGGRHEGVGGEPLPGAVPGRHAAGLAIAAAVALAHSRAPRLPIRCSSTVIRPPPCCTW